MNDNSLLDLLKNTLEMITVISAVTTNSPISARLTENYAKTANTSLNFMVSDICSSSLALTPVDLGLIPVGLGGIFRDEICIISDGEAPHRFKPSNT